MPQVGLRGHLHCQYVLAKTPVILHPDNATPICLGHLEQHNTKRIVSVCVILPKVAKVSRVFSLPMKIQLYTMEQCILMYYKNKLIEGSYYNYLQKYANTNSFIKLLKMPAWLGLVSCSVHKI
jgi:hypothetical protein